MSSSTQQSFAGALLGGEPAPPPGVVGPDGALAPKRFAVYRNNVAVSLIEALAANFPAIRNFVGEENFATLAQAYARRHPPTSPMMQAYGDRFAEFLDGFEPLAHAPFLADMARVEVAWLRAYHAADEPILTGDDLAGLEEQAVMAATVRPHPALALVRSRYAIADLAAWRDGEPGEHIRFDEAQSVLVTRPFMSVEVCVLDPARAVFFECLAGGGSLGLAVSEGLEADEDFDAAGTIALMLEAGAFAGFGNR